jgi:outer membrane biosynthesis protein TonB
MDAVTEVLLDRSHQADRLSQMMLVSLAAHISVLALVAVSPRLWPAQAQPDDSHVISISLAGAPGPIQGANPISAKPVQEAVPDASKARNDTPPAPAKPEMVEPVVAPKPEPKPVAKQEPKKETPQLRGRTPTQGAEVRQGTARVETGQTSAIPFGGLATGGIGAGARTEFGDFCCPEYLQTIQRVIQSNTNSNQGQVGLIVMKFVIRRDGLITDVSVAEGNSQFLELASRKALAQTQKLPPLPSAYTGERLTVLIDFRFK